MIIITSDEDIIRQFSFNKAKNTHIIDLDNDKQQIPNETDGINMALLAELSKLVCILFLKINIMKIFLCRIPVMIKFLNVHLIHLNRIHQNQLKYRENQWI